MSSTNSASHIRRVVVTGIGAVTSIGIGTHDFFDALAAGVSGAGKISLFDASSFPVSIAAEVKNFDLRAVGDRYPESRTISDRKVMFGLAAFDEAVHSAGLSPGTLSGERTSLNLGVSLEVFSIDEIAGSVVNRHLDFAGFYKDACTNHCRMQIPLDTTNTILVRRHRMAGMNSVNCSACAASAQSIGHSFRQIRRNDVDIAVCGGMDSMINPLGVGGFGLLGALSTSNELGAHACRPFDAKRNGTVLGEGAGILVLEELQHALRRSAKIYGEVVGYGSSLDAYKPTDPDPEGAGAALAMTAALRSAELGPEAIQYINAHGTSTPKNDEIETTAIKNVFGERAYAIPVSSTKSMVGHCIAASGAIECIASLSAFERNLLPPTINYSTKDFYCDLDYVPNTARAWGGDYIQTNSFGFGGQNASLILKRWHTNETS
jgi:3-oxoacyl-[acyl-carrier-protein] synthase II